MKWSLTSAAAEFGVSPTTVKAGLVANGIEIVHGKKGEFTTRQIFDALSGGLEQARALVERERAEKLRLQNSETRKELVQMAEAEAMIRTVLLPVRDLLLSAPTVLAARVNPADPEHARAQLQAWVDNGLKTVKP